MTPGQVITRLARSWDSKPGEVVPGQMIPGAQQLAPSEIGHCGIIMGTGSENQAVETEKNIQSANSHSRSRETKTANGEQTTFRKEEASEVNRSLLFNRY